MSNVTARLSSALILSFVICHCSLLLFLRVSIGMALHAIAEIRNARLRVCDLVFFRVVGVAVVARVLGINLHMTRRARNLAFAAVIDREGVLRQSGGRPALDRMAGRAIGSK